MRVRLSIEVSRFLLLDMSVEVKNNPHPRNWPSFNRTYVYLLGHPCKPDLWLPSFLPFFSLVQTEPISTIILLPCKPDLRLPLVALLQSRLMSNILSFVLTGYFRLFLLSEKPDVWLPLFPLVQAVSMVTYLLFTKQNRIIH